MEVQRIKSRPKLARANDGFSLLRAWDGNSDDVPVPIANETNNNSANNANNNAGFDLGALKLPTAPDSPPVTANNTSASPNLTPRTPRTPRPRANVDTEGKMALEDGSQVDAFSALRKLTFEMVQERPDEPANAHPKPAFSPRAKRAPTDDSTSSGASNATAPNPLTTATTNLNIPPPTTASTTAHSAHSPLQSPRGLVPLSLVAVSHDLAKEHMSPRRRQTENAEQQQLQHNLQKPAPTQSGDKSPLTSKPSSPRKDGESGAAESAKESTDRLRTSPREATTALNSSACHVEASKRRERRGSSKKHSEETDEQRQQRKLAKQKSRERNSAKRNHREDEDEKSVERVERKKQGGDSHSASSSSEDGDELQLNSEVGASATALSGPVQAAVVSGSMLDTMEREREAAKERQVESDQKEREIAAAELKIRQSLLEFEEKKKRIEEEKVKKQEQANKKKQASMERLKEMEKRGLELQEKLAAQLIEEERREREERERKEREERLKRERKEQKKKEKEEKEAQERAEKERLRIEREAEAERARAEAERVRAEKEKAREEREEKERIEKEKARIEREAEAERTRAEKERWREERLAAEQADRERIEREKLEKKRAREEKAEKDRLERLEREERERKLKEEFVDFELSQIASCVARGQCTYAATGNIATLQYGYVCNDCHSMKLCEVCVDTCHNSRRHLTMIFGKTMKKKKLVCECFASGKCSAHSSSNQSTEPSQESATLSEFTEESSTPNCPSPTTTTTIPSGAFMSSPRTHQKTLPTPQARAKPLTRDDARSQSRGAIEANSNKPLPSPQASEDHHSHHHQHHQHPNTNYIATASLDVPLDATSVPQSPSVSHSSPPLPSPEALLTSPRVNATNKSLPSPVPSLNKAKIEPPSGGTTGGAVSARALPTAPLKRQLTADGSTSSAVASSGKGEQAPTATTSEKPLVTNSNSHSDLAKDQQPPSESASGVVDELSAMKSVASSSDVSATTAPSTPSASVSQSASNDALMGRSPSKLKPLPPPKKSNASQNPPLASVLSTNANAGAQNSASDAATTHPSSINNESI